MADRIHRQRGKTRIGRAHGEMEQMKDDKCENDQSAHDHRARSEGGFYGVFAPVALGPGAAVFDRQTDRRVNVDEDDREEESANDPEERSEIAQMLRVAVDPIRAEENLEVAEKVADDEKNQDHARHRHNHFPANG